MKTFRLSPVFEPVQDGNSHGPMRVLARRESANAALEGLPLEVAYGYLRDLASVRQAVRECTHVSGGGVL